MINVGKYNIQNIVLPIDFQLLFLVTVQEISCLMVQMYSIQFYQFFACTSPYSIQFYQKFRTQVRYRPSYIAPLQEISCLMVQMC